MRTTALTKTLTALAIITLSQPLFATEAIYSNDCYCAKNEPSVTIDANKFTHVWLKLHNNNSSIADIQKHLQTYLEKALENNETTLDVQQFADLWDKAGNRPTEDHLTKKLAKMVEETGVKEDCYQATDEETK